VSLPRGSDDAYTGQYRAARTHSLCRDAPISLAGAARARKRTATDGSRQVDFEELCVAASQRKTKASEPDAPLEE
jgi:hypothetical protein